MMGSTNAVSGDEQRPRSRHGLATNGLDPSGRVYWNLSPPELYEQTLSRGDGRLAHLGGLAVDTAPHTGRSPKDKYFVRDDATESSVDWGAVNTPLSPDSYRALHKAVVAHLEDETELFVQDARAGQDSSAGINVRVVTPSPWHALFAQNMFLRPSAPMLEEIRPDFLLLHAPDLKADPARHGTRSGTFIVVNISDRTVLIGGTRYGGEIKKSIFSVLNHILPDEAILPMHCSANVGSREEVALFFGLSGTGKTTLSADPERGLIGDDEHGWGTQGVFNFEGGCYAKVIGLSQDSEPEIYSATRTFGTVLENVVLDPVTREVLYDDRSITENTRACYPIESIPNAILSGRGGHPENLIFLTCDAFGVLPPISKLTSQEAMYHFLSGYTAKVAGTERGVTEPKAVFSTCFGAPFLSRHPTLYSRMLGEKLESHGTRAWLVNTGWTGGGTGTGNRIRLANTRAMVRAALEGDLDDVETERDPVFGLQVPVQVPDVPSNLLMPRKGWKDPVEYDEAARRLAAMFRENFEQYRGEVEREVVEAGPR